MKPGLSQEGVCPDIDAKGSGCYNKYKKCRGDKYKMFQRIDIESWERREFYEHFINEVRCTYSTTVPIDITKIKTKRLYPAMIWLLTKTVNEMPEFRTALTDQGLGIYDEVHPAYTVFNKNNKNFSGIWTEFNPDYHEFLKSYEMDTTLFSSSVSYAPKPGRPMNTIDISMVPWFTFTAFDINVFDEGKYFLPIFTMGKFFDTEGKRMLPLAIQVHHAVCDGYHVGRFIEILQEKIAFFDV